MQPPLAGRMIGRRAESAVGSRVFGAGWFFVPGMFYNYWAIVPDTNQYMGRRYGAFMLGLMVISWLACNAPNTHARRAILVGSLVCWVLTDALACSARWHSG